MTKTTRPRVLTAEDVAAFDRDGFLVKRDLFGPQEIMKIGRWAQQLADAPEDADRHWMYFERSLSDPDQRLLNRIENFYPFHDGFRRLFDGNKLRGAVSDLLGEPAVLYKDKINFKLPGGEGFKPHQDQQAGWGKYADFFITAMVSIDAATTENGCLEFVAGGHKQGLLGKEWVPIGDEQWTAMGIRPYPTKPGDTVFFDSYAPHGSGPNLSDRPRRVLYVTYNRASAGDHREQYYADKFQSYPPDIARDPSKGYAFRV